MNDDELIERLQNALGRPYKTSARERVQLITELDLRKSLPKADDLAHRLTQALRRYGEHEMRCVAWGPSGSVDNCTCGLMDIIAEGKEATNAG